MIHAADTINRYVKQTDGRTAYHKIKGRPFRIPVTEWGDAVIYCRLDTVGKDKLEPRWEEGVSIEVHDARGEAIIATPAGVRDWKHMGTHQERRNGEFILSVKGTP